jgi:hypothetical protein
VEYQSSKSNQPLSKRGVALFRLLLTRLRAQVVSAPVDTLVTFSSAAGFLGEGSTATEPLDRQIEAVTESAHRALRQARGSYEQHTWGGSTVTRQGATHIALFVLFVSLVTLTPLSADRAVAQGACTESLQAQIDAAPPSSVVLAPPCVYREDVTIDKPLTLEGGGETEIRGSDVWEASRFSARADGTWVAPGYPEVGTNDSECEPGTSRCRWPEQVYYDGQPLTQVDPSSTPEGMQFAVDSERDLVVGADPSGRLVEVTVRDSWLTGKRGAKGVVIRDFTMKHSPMRASGTVCSRTGQ